MNTNHRQMMIDRLLHTNKKILWTVGYRWKNPTTLDVPVTTEKAVEIIKCGRYALCELEEKEDRMLLQCYTSNDMW